MIVLDPMLATGGSAIDAISQIKKRGPKSIKFMGIIAAPEGLDALCKAHPDIDNFCAALDENDDAWIYPPRLRRCGRSYFRYKIIPIRETIALDVGRPALFF